MAQKKPYRIAYNKICLNTGFDLDALKEEFESLCQLDDLNCNLIRLDQGTYCPLVYENRELVKELLYSASG